VLAWSLPFGFAVLWASSYAAAKIGLADITPFAFVALRLVLAAIGAALILLVRRTAWDALGPTWPHLVVGGARAGVVAIAARLAPV
jgi:drug/metabolite transporter (DMT)-like permease